MFNVYDCMMILNSDKNIKYEKKRKRKKMKDDDYINEINNDDDTILPPVKKFKKDDNVSNTPKKKMNINRHINQIKQKKKRGRKPSTYDCPLDNCLKNISYAELKSHSHDKMVSPKHLSSYLICYWCDKIFLHKASMLISLYFILNISYIFLNICTVILVEYYTFLIIFCST